MHRRTGETGDDVPFNPARDYYMDEVMANARPYCVPEVIDLLLGVMVR